MRRSWQRLRALDAEQWRIVLLSTVLVPAVGISLRRRGFQRTAVALAERSNRAPIPPDVDAARRAADAVAVVAGRSVIGARCLGRSLALWFVLRRRGVDAELVIGADAPAGGALPAHAWVEVDGVAVNDQADVRDRFGSFGLTLPRLGSPAR